MSKSPAHIAMLVFWAIVVFNSIMPLPYPLSSIVPILAAILVCVHVLQIIMNRDRIENAEGYMAFHVAMVMIFGTFHVRTLPARA